MNLLKLKNNLLSATDLNELTNMFQLKKFQKNQKAIRNDKFVTENKSLLILLQLYPFYEIKTKLFESFYFSCYPFRKPR